MKISEMIIELSLFQSMHGDLECEMYDIAGRRRTHPGPRGAFRKILSGRESVPRFSGGVEDRGEKVCRL
jgi:hypothetical protein